MDLLNLIKEYWTIIVFIGAVIISWTRYESKNTLQDREIKEIDDRLKYTENKLTSHIETHMQTTNLLTQDMAIIKTNLEYIKQAIEELKAKKK